MIRYAKEKPEKTFYLIQQTPIRDESHRPHPEAIVREIYLSKRMKGIAEATQNIETFNIPYEADLTGHPTELGTRTILECLDKYEIPGHELIWDERISTDRPYSRIQSIYRYGCNGCEKYGRGLIKDTHNNPLLCDECFGRFPEEENEQLKQVYKMVEKAEEARRERDFPKRRKENDGMD